MKIGDKFGRWTVVELVPRVSPAKPNSRAKVQCDCGTVRVINRNSLPDGKSRSCGCLKLKGMTKHGCSIPNTPEYEAWGSMKSRCYCVTNASYQYYGGKGITVAVRWLDSFNNFLEDMGPKPGPRYTLDRRNLNLGYERDNCRWATKMEQANNRTNNRWIIWKGKRQTVAQWAREAGIQHGLLWHRVFRLKWSMARVMGG